MYYSGFADEAASSLDLQIKATKELGWSNIEVRNIDGTTLADMSDEMFETVFEKLEAENIKINCFGSRIANWGKSPRSEEDFQASIDELKKAIPRMQRLGTTMVRGMSFAVAQDEEPDNPELEQIIFKKVRTLVKICEEAGIIYVHENCMNYGGMSHLHTLKLLENVASPNFKLVFDTGNPISTWNRIGKKPYKKQKPFDFYQNVKDHIHYVHIKDGVYECETDGIFPKARYTFPGEGDGQVPEIIIDLLKNGYDGGFSMEPHMTVVFHEEGSASEDKLKYENYIEYGRRFMRLIEDAKKNI